MTDDELIQSFMQSNLSVREFARQKIDLGHADPFQIFRLKDQLMKVAYAKINHRPEKYTVEYYRCDECTLPHRVVYKHNEDHRCPVCSMGESEPNPKIVHMMPPFFCLVYSGETTRFMGTVIHAMNIEVNGIPMKFDDDYLSKLKAEIVEHDHSHL